MANLKPFLNPDVVEAGCDEAGRGCLAGPVYAAAVILPKDFYHPLLNDSKQLTKKQRDELRPIIMKEAVSYGIASVSPKEIDKINILNASIKAMHKALNKLKPQPKSIIVDGNKFKPYKKIQHKCIVKGDATYASIAAASILAKTGRDAYMLKIAKEFPQYGWDKNMAYPTKEHRAAIEKYGATKYHRMTYRLLPELKLF
ncbi:MAG: ribonuclease HII [Bacteroidales bacterium]|jgi:Ribonuclease HII|nr:ribonuclease HII [Bacteroidales bacterium]MDD4420985.1 ribonuclease HII [Bacteroidales bacterium]